MKHRFWFLLKLSLCFTLTANADSTLEYDVHEAETQPSKVQSVFIKGGKILVKDLGGGGKLEFIYSANPEILFIVDHGKREVMALDEGQINKIAKQADTVQPLLKGLGEQLGKLDPNQRAKWEAMLGGKVDLNTIAEAAKPVQAGKIIKSGKNRKVAGIECQPMSFVQGKVKAAEICMADPAKLNLDVLDYATIRSLLNFLERITSKTQGLAKQFGINLPNLNLRDVNGVPIEIVDLSSQNQSSLSLKRVVGSVDSVDLMKIPEGYQLGPFKLWK